MSAMLESYDMQVLEYTPSNDIDIQMHPTSDSWAHDETQMEEDGPSPHRLSSPHHQRADNSLSMKTDSLIKDGSDVAIEIDMLDYAGEEHVEYEMLDAADHFEAGPDILDVEVFDASHAHTPTLNPAPLEEPKSVGLLTPQPPSAPLPSLSSPALHPISTPAPFPEAGPSEPAEVIVPENHLEVDHSPVDHGLPSPGRVLPASSALGVAVVDSNPSDPPQVTPELAQDTHSSHTEDVPAALAVPGTPSSGDAVAHVAHPAPAEAGPAHWDVEAPQSGAPAPSSTFSHPHEVQGDEAAVAPDAPTQGHTEADHGHGVPSGYDHGVQEETGPLHAPSASSGDPHEISEGVYIDPPPPVLLSLAEEFSFSLFNRPTSVDSGQVADLEAVHIVLEQSPTLFYEPLDTVFEALKHEEVVQSLPGFPECELVLEAVDLGLSLSEDNINSRSMSLHDLNMLHDSLGIHGRLRVKLSTGEVRFLARYHALEEQIARIQSEVQSSDHYVPHPLHVSDSSEEDKLLYQHADKPEQVDHDATSAAQLPSTEDEGGIPPIPDSDENVPATEEHHQEAEDYPEEQYDPATVQGIDHTEPRDDHYQDPEFQPNAGDDHDADDRSHTLSDHDDSHSGVVSGHQDTVHEAVREAEPAVVPDEVGEDENTSTSYNESEEVEETYDPEVTQDVPEAPDYDEGDVDGGQEAAEDQQEQDVPYWDNPEEGEYEDNDAQDTTDEDGEPAEADQDYGEPETAENEPDNAEAQDNERSESGDLDDDHNSVTVIVNEQVVQLELPSEPLEFDDEDWDDELDGEGDLDAAWDADPENPLPSVDVAEIDCVPSPLSSKSGGKRNYDQVDVDEDEETWDQASGTGSPGSKRSRVQ